MKETARDVPSRALGAAEPDGHPTKASERLGDDRTESTLSTIEMIDLAHQAEAATTCMSESGEWMAAAGTKHLSLWRRLLHARRMRAIRRARRGQLKKGMRSTATSRNPTLVAHIVDSKKVGLPTSTAGNDREKFYKNFSCTRGPKKTTLQRREDNDIISTRLQCISRWPRGRRNDGEHCEGRGTSIEECLTLRENWIRTSLRCQHRRRKFQS